MHRLSEGEKMKFARVSKDGTIYHTVLKDNKFYPLEGDFFSYAKISNIPLERADKILSPVMPSKVIALGLNYRLHIKELHPDFEGEPVIFIKPDTSVIGHNDAIIRPRNSKRVDYEAELAFVIKSECRNISEEDAGKYILGYTCLNDVTARDLQKIDGQWTRAKGFDTFCPIGPYIATGIDPDNLEIMAILNGEVKQHANTSDMLYTVPQILAYISRIMTLRQGDVICTGTPGGIGPMNAGDVIEIRIENIGSLINTVKDEE